MKNNLLQSTRLFLMTASAVFSCQAMSQTTSTVKTVGIKKGQHEVEFKAGTIRQRGDERKYGASVGYEYGITHFWSTKLSIDYARQAPAGTGLEEIAWQNKFRLTPPDRFPLDVGLLTEIGWAKDRSEGYRFKFGPLFEKKIDAVQLNANFLFERYSGETPARETEMSYQWQAKYEWKEDFQFGLQGFGEMGPWNDWAPRSEQSHLLGPVLFGEVSLGSDQKLEYSVAYLADPSSRARSHGFRMKVEYIF